MISLGASEVIEPSSQIISDFLEWAFGGDLDGLHNGLIEIATVLHQGDKTREEWRPAHLFGTDEIDEAVEFAVEQNRTGRNIYFGVALRHPLHPRTKRGNKAAVIGTKLLWCDWDDEIVLAGGREASKVAPPNVCVITGTKPGIRAQGFWKLSEAITSVDEIDAAINGVALKLLGDPKVVHADCLMRLPGCISWVKHGKEAEGRINELVNLQVYTDSRPAAYDNDALLRSYHPVLPDITRGGYEAPPVVRAASSLGVSGKITDGRESYMRDTVLACLIEFAGTNGALPTEDELFEVAWEQYSKNVDFSRSGRGSQEMRLKCRYTIRRAELGRIRGLETLERIIERFNTKDDSRQPPFDEPDLPVELDESAPTCVADLIGTAPERQWLIPQWLPANTVTACYGDGGIGKTLLAQQLATAHAVGGLWCGIQVPKGRALAVFCEDDLEEAWRRQDAIDAAYGITLRAAQLTDLFIWDRVGYDNVLQTFDRDNKGKLEPFYHKLCARIEAIRPSLLILDTAADMFGGNENIRNQVNQFVKGTLASIVQRYDLTALLLAHPSLSGINSGAGTGGSTGWNNSVRSRWYFEKVKDGLPDQRILTRKKANYAASGDEQALDLIWEGGAFTTKPGPDSLERMEEKAMERAILDAIETAWLKKKPYTAIGDRSYKRALPYDLKGYRPASVVRIFEQLAMRGIVSKDHGDSSIRGYKVMDK